MDRAHLVRAFALIALAASSASADIYQWEWVDPNDHSLGKRQSNVLCPDGAGVTIEPNSNEWGHDLTKAYLFDAELHHVRFDGSIFHGAYMANANFDGASFWSTRMADADLSGASFVDVFQNGYTQMMRVNFTDANLTDTYFRYSYLTDVNFTRANLTDVTFDSSSVAGANFTDAIITGARMPAITRQQFESTRSYRDGQLQRVKFMSWNDLRGWNFASADLTGAWFQANLTNANFHRAQLDDSFFTSTDLRGADFRGALDLEVLGSSTDRAIMPDGTLHLVEGGGVRIRNFRGEIGIHITGSVSDGGFDVFFDDQPWISTISFAPGISVELGSTLSLGFEPGIVSPEMIGRTFQVFDWTGVAALGQFQTETNGLQWDTSHLYTEGIVTLLAIPEPTTLSIVALALIAPRRPRRA